MHVHWECFPQGYITDQERALEDLFGEDVENSRKFDGCLNVMAARIATVFASLKVCTYASHNIDLSCFASFQI